jgi:hypothetical protein
MRNLLAARGLDHVVSVSIRQVLQIEADDLIDFAEQLANERPEDRQELMWEWLNDNLYVATNALGRRGRQDRLVRAHEFVIRNHDVLGVGRADMGRAITVRGGNLDILQNIEFEDL